MKFYVEILYSSAQKNPNMLFIDVCFVSTQLLWLKTMRMDFDTDGG